MKERIFLSTNYGLIPVTARDSKEDERFVFLTDSTGLVSAEFARETVDKYLRGEINTLLA